MPRNSKQSREPRVKKFRVTVADDTTHRTLRVAKFTRWSFFVTIISILLLILIAASLLIAYTPLKSLIPGYAGPEVRQASAQNALKVDSLERVITRWEFYSENIKRILDGEDPIQIDSIVRQYTPARDTMDASALAVSDSLLRQSVIAADQFSVRQGQHRHLPNEGQHFFTPLKGLVVKTFDRALQPYIEISAPANSVVMSVLDGTVISAQWSDENRYTIIVQHSDAIISIYRRSEKLLHKAGDKILAGTPIALIGGTETAENSGNLQFELWHDGEAVDPTDYISF